MHVAMTRACDVLTLSYTQANREGATARRLAVVDTLLEGAKESVALSTTATSRRAAATRITAAADRITAATAQSSPLLPHPQRRSSPERRPPPPPQQQEETHQDETRRMRREAEEEVESEEEARSEEEAGSEEEARTEEEVQSSQDVSEEEPSSEEQEPQELSPTQDGKRFEGRRIKLWWAGDGVWYEGRVHKYSYVLRDGDPHKFMIYYDDGDRKAHYLAEGEKWRLLPMERAGSKRARCGVTDVELLHLEQNENQKCKR